MISVKITWVTRPFGGETKHEHTIMAANWEQMAEMMDSFVKSRSLCVDRNEVKADEAS